MKLIRTISSMMLITGIALQGCSKPVGKEIVPGAFVQDRPIQLTQSKLADDGKCIIDVINGKKADKSNAWKVKRGDELVFRGWAFSEDGTKAVAPLFIRITGAVQDYYAITSARHARSDVNEHFNLAPELAVGFELQASIAQVEPGVYAIAVVLPSSPEHVEACTPRATLIVN
jgi:hypothetical protein